VVVCCTVECVRITWSQSLVHRHSCFEHDQTRHVIQRTWKSSFTDTWRSPTKRFCRWIVLCFMCSYESSHDYSHVCSKVPCLDDNLVHYLHLSTFGTLSQQWSSKSGQDMLPCDFELCGKWLAFRTLFTKFVSSCASRCVKSHKDRVVIVPQDLICMIHGLVVTTHLEDELVSFDTYT